MARWSSIITGSTNSLTLLLGLFLLGMGGCLSVHHDRMPCLSLIRSPCLKIGVIVVVVSLLGLLGTCFRSPFMLWLYLIIYVILIIMVAVGGVLWIMVMSKGYVRLDIGETRKLNDFTFWFQDQVLGIEDWPKVKNCLLHTDICSSHTPKNIFLFSDKIKQGCCRPPPVCKKNFLTIHDCDVWKNEAATMCYNCSSCSEGFISKLSEIWQSLFPGVVTLLVFLIIVFIFGCLAFKQIRNDQYKKLYNTVKA